MAIIPMKIISYIKFGLILLTTLFLLACENSETDPVEKKPDSVISQAETKSDKTEEYKELPQSAFEKVEWIDLMPKDNLDALMNPPSYISDVEEGSFEDQISNELQNTIATANDDRYQQAMISTEIIPEMDGKPIQIPGFIVPLEFSDDQTVTEFFLVPFFGACIHVPPPPPNQVIFVKAPQGLELKALYDPFWISGVLKTSLVENEVATAAYTMQLQSYELYSEEY